MENRTSPLRSAIAKTDAARLSQVRLPAICNERWKQRSGETPPLIFIVLSTTVTHNTASHAWHVRAIVTALPISCERNSSARYSGGDAREDTEEPTGHRPSASTHQLPPINSGWPAYSRRQLTPKGVLLCSPSQLGIGLCQWNVRQWVCGVCWYIITNAQLVEAGVGSSDPQFWNGMVDRWS